MGQGREIRGEVNGGGGIREDEGLHNMDPPLLLLFEESLRGKNG